MITMLQWILPLHFLSLFLLCVSPSNSSTINDPIVGLVACPPHQIRAFRHFKNEFDTRHCNQSDDFNGVWCDNSTGAVTKLQLRSCLSGTLKSNSSLFRFHQLRYLNLSRNNFISCSLLPEFGNLNKLEVLSLSFNGFLGQVPSSFSNLSMLSKLDLSQNHLTGSFPLVGNLTKITVLNLSHNHFSGNLNPDSGLFDLHRLRILNLAFNNFNSSLPSNFGNLHKLEILALSSNDFFGQVPHTISNLTQLTKLALGKNKLTGRFPLVENLTKLSDLRLHQNHFTGTIPSSLLAMPFLSYINLRGNSLSGCIEVPNSTFSSRLEHFLLGSNHFGEKILEPISKLIAIKHLDLSFLNTSYPIDLSLFSSLKSLKYLELAGNSIFPSSLRSDSNCLSSLEVLGLSGCNIIEFPNMIKTLHNLVSIDISNNRIKGKVPEWLWNLPRLSIVSMSNNSFNGFEGSAAVLANSSVTIVDLQHNHFQGTLPILPDSISILEARFNRFTGSIPLSICNLSSLSVLDLSYNDFTGPIPQCFMSNLTLLNLRKNKLEGSLPDMFYVGASLRTLDFGYNRLTGKLPRSLLHCFSLAILNVEHNGIQDTFPFWLKALPKLQVLSLRSNKFSGPISPSDQGPLGFTELRVLLLSDNNFTGNLSPGYFVNWKASSATMNEDGGLYMVDKKNPYGSIDYTLIDHLDLQYKGLPMKQARLLTSYSAIDLSRNRLGGQIPESIGLLKALIALNLSNNAFTGNFPSSLANLKKLESLDLSNNRLSGTIPNGLGSLSFLSYINVSHNNLKGEIPQGTQITGQPKSSFEGNARLCGLPLDESCFGNHSPPAQQPKEEANEEEEQVLNWKAVAIGYGPGVLLGLAIGQVIASYKPEWLAKIIGPNMLRTR